MEAEKVIWCMFYGRDGEREDSGNQDDHDGDGDDDEKTDDDNGDDEDDGAGNHMAGILIQIKNLRFLGVAQPHSSGPRVFGKDEPLVEDIVVFRQRHCILW